MDRLAAANINTQVLDIQEKKKNLVREAFAGMKNKETQRQKKEARLQGVLNTALQFYISDQASRYHSSIRGTASWALIFK